VKASIASGRLALAAIVFSLDGVRELSETIQEQLDAALAPSTAEDCGKRLAERMLARGVAAILGKESVG
jgi:porphobilinogen deaminase